VVSCGVLCCVLCSKRVGVDNIRVWEETTLAAANKMEEERRKYDEQVGQPLTGHACSAHARFWCGRTLWAVLGTFCRLHLGC
jgi:hypothetical protein